MLESETSVIKVKSDQFYPWKRVLGWEDSFSLLELFGHAQTIDAVVHHLLSSRGSNLQISISDTRVTGFQQEFNRCNFPIHASSSVKIFPVLDSQTNPSTTLHSTPTGNCKPEIAKNQIGSSAAMTTVVVAALLHYLRAVNLASVLLMIVIGADGF